jgi:hypothetical protein
VAVDGDLPTASHWFWFDLHVRAVGGRLRADHTWVERFHLPAEAERGLKSVDNHLRVGEAELDLAPGRWCGLAVGLGGDLPLLRAAGLPAALARFQEREGRLLARARDLVQAPDWVRRLPVRLAPGRRARWRVRHRRLPLVRRVGPRHPTRYYIRLDPRDGLLRVGEEGVQLTWMDAKVDGWVVTPRTGKPVEVNALWHNALVVMAGLAERLGRDGGAYRDLAERAREGFQRFLRPDGLGLYDVLDGPDGLGTRPTRSMG